MATHIESNLGPIPLTEDQSTTRHHETCTTVTTTTTEQLSTNELSYIDTPSLLSQVTTGNGLVGSGIGIGVAIGVVGDDTTTMQQQRGNISSPVEADVGVAGVVGGKVSPTALSADYTPPNRRVTEVIESTLALSTEIVMSKDENDCGDEGDDEDANENDEEDAADLDIELDLGTIETTGADTNDDQMIRITEYNSSNTASSSVSRKKSVFINENALISNEPCGNNARPSLFKANSIDTSKKRNSNGKNETSGSNQRRPSTLQRLFKLKL